METKSFIAAFLSHLADAITDGDVNPNHFKVEKFGSFMELTLTYGEKEESDNE